MTIALHATGGADSTFDPTRTHAHFCRACVIFHHAHSAWINISKDLKSPRHRFVFTSITFFDVVANITHCPFSLFSHQFLHHPDFQRPQRPWQGVAETAQAHTLAGVECLTERLTQLQTQVMRPSSPELPQPHGHIAHAEAIPPDSHHDFQCQDDVKTFAAIRSIQQQQTEFFRRSDLQASRNRWQIMCRVDFAFRKLVQFRTENLLQKQLSSSQSKWKSDRDTCAFAER